VPGALASVVEPVTKHMVCPPPGLSLS